MTDILQMALGGLSRLPHRIVRYQRGDDHIDLEVTVAATRAEYENEHGVRIRSEIRDYLIPPESLILDSNQVEPQEGDEVVDTGEGVTRTYRVMGVEAGEAWRWTDRYHTMLRVHTREVDEA